MDGLNAVAYNRQLLIHDLLGTQRDHDGGHGCIADRNIALTQCSTAAQGTWTPLIELGNYPPDAADRLDCMMNDLVFN